MATPVSGSAGRRNAPPSVPRGRIRRVNQLLIELYGERQPEPRDPLDGIILIILSQATNDYNCDRAFTALKAAFPTWEQALEAPVGAIADAIRSGGLANQKAARIQQLLRDIQADRNSLDLGWMHVASAADCEAYLSKFAGVGPKTIACVLVFFLNKPAFPVDTHVFRVVKRLGWIRPTAGTDEAHTTLKAMVPPDCMLNLHVNLISHGRAICRAAGNGGPHCVECALRKLCDYGSSLGAQELLATATPVRKTKSPDPARDPDFFVTIKQKKDLSA